MGDLFLDRAVLFHGDCRARLSALGPEWIDACVTDAPYELGFMGKGWDKTGIAFQPETWAVVLRALKPGAYLLAFGGTRTYHRMTCAIEDAGFEIRDSLHWFYGTGFPKSLNLGGGVGTALKPGHEPIVLARKPLVGNVATNIGVHGTGGLNIDACRLVTTDNLNGGTYSGGKRQPIPGDERTSRAAGRYGEDGRLNPEDYRQPAGRWPANVLLDEGAAAELDAQTAHLKAGGHLTGDEPSYCTRNAYGNLSDRGEWAGYGDSGGASRFFYCAKVSREERDLYCDALPERSGGEATDRKDGSAGLANPRAGAGRTGGSRNHHPTVKPVALLRWLCRLITPSGGIVLDPFTGSGSTAIAALEEGHRFVGVELSDEYLPIAHARITGAHNAIQSKRTA